MILFQKSGLIFTLGFTATLDGWITGCRCEIPRPIGGGGGGGGGAGGGGTEGGAVETVLDESREVDSASPRQRSSLRVKVSHKPQ